MSKKEKTKMKIISKLIIFILVFSFFQFASSAQAGIYDNPNQSNAKNPYKFKVSDVVNSNLLTHVVGCTGVVNKVSGWMVGFVQSPAKKTQETADKLERWKDKLKASCANVKAGAEAVGGAIPFVNDAVKSIDTVLSQIKTSVPSGGVSSALGPGAISAPAGVQKPQTPKGSAESVKACQDQIESADPKVLEEIRKQTIKDNERDLKEQCFDGIAITLAKNQLTAMTRSMMNWVNSGYGGNPFFVQNMQNFTNNIEKNVLETGIDILLSPSNKSPYASDFARSTIKAKRGVVSGSANFLGTLQSDLENFVSDEKSYYTNDQLGDAQDTRDALQRAKDANRAFENDFSTGGWGAWLALTQKDQNNPLGFSMLANQYLSEVETTRVNEVKDELAQNNGFLSQKTCVEWAVYDEEGHRVPKYKSPSSLPGISDSGELATTKIQPNSGTINCTNYKTITPGSIIRDKTTSYLNSPERQLELAKTINDSLNALFSILISKLEEEGLSGLSDSNNVDTTSNWVDKMNVASVDGNTPYNNNGAYDGFNLVRDLGNTYYHVTLTNHGTWNAKTNITTDNNNKILYPDLAPGYYNDDNKFVPYTDNPYYTVTTEGNTQLMLEGYNGWKVGDRAFWNGSAWQNWKKGIPNPIKNRGVIQIQQDYIVAAKEILKVLPSIMPNLGELDYCIPGPNPSYETNSTDAQTAYENWLGSMYVGPIDNTNERFGVRIHQPANAIPGVGDGDHGTENGSSTYDILTNIYSDNPNIWPTLTTFQFDSYNPPSNPTIPSFDSISLYIKQFSYICDTTNGNTDCSTDYLWANNGNMNKEDNGSMDGKKAARDRYQEFATKMFGDFYANFGKKMNDLYFNNMTSKYREYESDTKPTENNPEYIPMAINGLDLTKNMLFYNDDISKVTEDYATSINLTKVNITKLEPIKTEVSQIILAAQARRDARLLEQINKVNQTALNNCKEAQTDCDNQTENVAQCLAEYNSCIEKAVTSGSILSKEEYLTKYASCLEEEKIQVFDADTIEGTNSEAGKCTNKIDDDLDGLIDRLDPDCASSSGDSSGSGSGTSTGSLPTITSPTSDSKTVFLSEIITLRANITSLGDPATLIENGFCWGTSPSPTSCHNNPFTATTTGVFSTVAGGGLPFTKYYYRAYATNATGTAYTEDGTYTTQY
jgi:hypothetical protein